MRTVTRYLTAIISLFLLFRIVAFSVSYDAFDDFIPRIRIALEWAQNPHFITDTSLVQQYGPVHIYLLGIGLSILNDPLLMPRVISFIAGCTLLFPFYIFCKEYFSQRIALLSLLFLSFYTLHIKYSVVTASESLFVTLVVSAFAGMAAFYNRPKKWYLVIAGFSLGFACLTRYEGLFFIPFMPLVWIRSKEEFNEFFKIKSPYFQSALIFYAALIVPTGFWFVSNLVFSSDLLPAFQIINESHSMMQTVVKKFVKYKSHLPYQIAYIPGVFFITLTPPVFLGLIWGIFRAFKNKKYKFYLLIVLALLFTMVMSGKYILVRYTILIGTLLIPISAYGCFSIYRRLFRHKFVLGLSLLVTFSFIWIGALLVLERGEKSMLTERLWSVSPISYMRPEVGELIDFLNREARHANNIVTDLDVHMRLRPIKLYAHQPDREIRQAYRGRHLKKITKKMDDVVHDIVHFFNAEYVITIIDSPLDAELAKRAITPKKNDLLQVRLALQNRYYRVYKVNSVDVEHQLNN